MSAVSSVAVVGAGIAGLAAAIRLADAGVAVDVFERKPEISAVGSGITLQGNALRALDELGVWDEVRALGYGFNGFTMRAPGPTAPVIADLPEVQTGGPDYPAGMGMYRPDLAKILHDRAVELGARVQFDTEVSGIEQHDERVDLLIGGEVAGTYDLVIGADGLNSVVRALIGIETKPEPTGVGAWRAFVSRPAEVTHSEGYYGGPVYIAGYTPTGEDSMYAFLVEKAQQRPGVSSEEGARVMIEQSAAYGGPWEQVRDDLRRGGAPVNYTWFTKHVVPAPWNRGRTVIIGDAAHSCPPTIAQGAAQALEDTMVLTELLLTRDVVDADLWDAFHGRRVERARTVVEASVQMGQWQLDGVRDADVPGLLHDITALVVVPA